jgi:hypothetical protein
MIKQETIVKAALQAARYMMPGGTFEELNANDALHQWEFVAVHGLEERVGVTGIYRREWPLVTVVFDSSLAPEEQLMAQAHEVGHHFLHVITGRDPDEGEAEQFARRWVESDPQRSESGPRVREDV